MDLLATSLWLGAAGGVCAVAVAVVRRTRRRHALLIAALLFLPIGILGILSIGIAFLIAAALCFVAAVVTRPHRDVTAT